MPKPQTVRPEPTQMPLLLLVQGVALENTAQTLQQQVQLIASHVWLERLALLLEQQVKMLVYLVKQGNMSLQMERLNAKRVLLGDSALEWEQQITPCAKLVMLESLAPWRQPIAVLLARLASRESSAKKQVQREYS